MNFKEFQNRCKWKIKTRIVPLQVPAFSKIETYDIGDIVTWKGKQYIRIIDSGFFDMAFQRHQWECFADACAATSMTCAVHNCASWELRLDVLKDFGLFL